MVLSFIGDLFSRFKKKKTSIETLEELDKKIKEIEKNKETNLLNERKVIGTVILYSVFGYILIALLYICIPSDVFDPTIARILLLVIPILLYLTRRFLKWFYIKRVGSCETKLNLLKNEKKKIIEEVKEKETYKKAREILERFSSEADLNEKKQQTAASPQQQAPQVLPQQQPRPMVVNRPMEISRTESGNFVMRNPQMMNGQRFTNNEQMTRTLVPRPFIPQDRSTIDKLLDYFIGDGPSNRYALICKRCASHNGMALKEEFEYIAFRCAYCSEFNPSRKMKLNAPDIKTLLGQNSEATPAKVKTDSEKEEESDGKIEEIANNDDEQKKEVSEEEVSAGEKTVEEKKNE